LKNLKISHFDPMRPRAGISTSEIHFIISKMVSTVIGQMPQKCPCRCTNPLAQTVYPLQGGKVHPNFENQKKNFSEKNFLASTTTKKYAESIGEIRF